MKKIILVFIWFFSTLTVVFFGLFILSFSTSSIVRKSFVSLNEQQRSVLGVYAKNTDNIVGVDARPKIVETFLKKYHSALEPYDYYAQVLVEIADRYGLDFRLLPAIAMQESNLCRKVPNGSNNCWGHGIYGGRVLYYESSEKAIESVAKTLAKYSQKGLASPEEIMRKYTPSSDGTWAAAVLHFMAEMR